MSSFGETLRRERELRGIDLREVAEATKISVRFLQALENDRLDVLPGGIFPRAFVRQYAAYLGLDAEKIVAEFMYAAAGDSVPAAPRATTSARARPIPLGLAMAGLAALALGLLAWRQLRSEPQEPTVQARPAPATAPPHSFPNDRVYPPPTATPGAVAPTEGLVLELTANQACWVAVQADGVRVLDRVLSQGETQRFTARGELVLSVGNAGGIAFRINGRTGVPLGRDGEVRRNIVITHQSMPSLLDGAPAAAPVPPSPRSG
jgi:cytoskeleton protein RodZ